MKELGMSEEEHKETEERRNRRADDRNILQHIWSFLRVRKVWWLTPIIFMLLFVSTLIISANSQSVLPFIYALF